MDIAAIVTAGVLILTTAFGIYTWYKKQPKEKIDVSTEVINQMRVLNQSQQEAYEWLTKRVNKSEKNFQECEYGHEVTKLELQYLRNQTGYKAEKIDVFVLDDNSFTIEEFKRGFIAVSMINFTGFQISEKFLAAVKDVMPAVVIIDYNLGRGQTAEDIISQLGYVPEIFIISMSGEIEAKISGKNIRFFKKDDFYVHLIKMEIIKFLTDKIKS